ncbi:MAG: hypothetical protein J7621_20980 [Niastella sp.]|nr:hypothetical protein [Niastella sp.]
MSDHEFEKQVQLKMEQLRLRPSNAVWTEVEKNIRRDKRRRRMIMWLPVALLFLGAGGYFAMTKTAGSANHVVSQATPSSTVTPSSTQNDQPSTSTSTQQTQENTLPATTPAANTATAPNTPTSDKITSGNPVTTAPAIDKATPTIEPGSKEPAIITNNTAKTAPTKADGKKTTHIIARTTKESNKNNFKSIMPSVEQAKKNSAKENKIKSELATNKQENHKSQTAETEQPTVLQRDSSVAVITASDSTQTIQDVATGEPAVATVDSNSLAQVTTVDSVAKDSAAQTIAAVPPVAVPEVAQAAKVQKKAGPSNWQFGVQVEGGYSGVTKDGLFGFLEKNYTQVPDLASPSFNNSVTYTPQFPRPVSKPSNLTMGLSFSVGGFVKRALSNRLSLSAGLQYTYLSTRQVVGSKVSNNRTVNRAPSTSQVVNEYYNAGNFASLNNPGHSTQNYTNRYQFIELPITLHTQLNRGKRLPIIWDAGFSVSKLLNTNALHYDGLGGVYYQDKNLFNKTQWAIATGFNVQLFKHTQHPLTVGPVMRYNITPMLKKDYSTGQHVWAVGLRASVLLKK